MKRQRFLIGTAAAATVAVAAAADGCSSSNRLFSIGGSSAQPYTLTVGYTDGTVGGYRLHTRTYNGSTVGPTLDVYPGTTFEVNVVNNLPPNPPQSLPTDLVRHAAPRNMMETMRRIPAATLLSSTPLDPMNNPNSFNTTNLHVHGIQTIPHLFDPIGTSNPAAMMLAIEPGSSFSYRFPVPADQPSGLYWYHPHHHGATDVQVAGGMAGLIVVHGPIDQVPEIAAARDVRLCLQSLNMNLSATDPTLYEYEPVAYVAAPQGYNLGTDFSLYTLNGQGIAMWDNTRATQTPLALPQYTMAPGEVIRLRILNGCNEFKAPLVLPGCDIFVIAYDGINFTAAEEIAQNGTTLVTGTSMYDNNFVHLGPGMRAEMLIRAPLTPGTYKLSALATDGVNFQPVPALDIADFVVAGSPVTMNIPTTLPTPTREYPAIQDSEIVATKTITFSNGPAPTLLTGVGFLIDGLLYDAMEVNYSAAIGTCEEWIIENTTTETHPFHLHENSFEVIAYNGVTVPTTIRDTVLIPPADAGNGSVTIRIRFKGDRGKTVFHCHILAHEDTGMMQNLMMV